MNITEFRFRLNKYVGIYAYNVVLRTYWRRNVPVRKEQFRCTRRVHTQRGSIDNKYESKAIDEQMSWNKLYCIIFVLYSNSILVNCNTRTSIMKRECKRWRKRDYRSGLWTRDEVRGKRRQVAREQVTIPLSCVSWCCARCWSACACRQCRRAAPGARARGRWSCPRWRSRRAPHVAPAGTPAGAPRTPRSSRPRGARTCRSLCEASARVWSTDWPDSPSRRAARGTLCER